MGLMLGLPKTPTARQNPRPRHRHHLSLKAVGEIPGDASARRRSTSWPTSPNSYSHDELRVTHAQNIVLPHVAIG